MKSLISVPSPTSKRRSRKELLSSVESLIKLHKTGALGGEKMPEDANPGLNRSSIENFHYFTLPMALNYQRNSYKLWESALATFNDKSTRFVFDPISAISVEEDELRAALCKHKLALQSVRHIQIWTAICKSLCARYRNDVRNLLQDLEYDIAKILDRIQGADKRGFPYLSGPKIANYWLYVLTQYTDAPLKNRQMLSVAPDTHVMQASIKLGLVDHSGDESMLRSHVADAWRNLLDGTSYSPIDVHTPLWLWSRLNFAPEI